MALPRKGDIVHCPGCGKALLKFVIDITGGKMMASQVEAIGDHVVRSNDRCECWHCGAVYMSTTGKMKKFDTNRWVMAPRLVQVNGA